MADWDVIGTAPAQLQDPWAVRSLAPAPTTAGDVVKGVGDAALSGASKVATGVVGAPIALANRLIAALSGGDGQMAADAAHEYVNRTFGHDTQTPVGKQIGAAVQAALAPLGESANAGKQLLEQGGQKLGLPTGAVSNQLSEAGDIVGTAGVVAPIAAGAAASGEAATMATAKTATDPAIQLGLRTAENNPIARSVAGSSGREALNLQNHDVGNTVAGAQAGVPHGSDVSYDSLAAARNAPNAVYGRVAENLPTAPLSPGAAAAVQAAGGANRITQGTPDAITNVQALKDQLLEPGRAFTGDQVVNESRGLRQEGGTNIASDDVSKQQLGRAQLDMARGLEQHITDTLPDNGTTSLAQFQGARTALAKNYAVQSALRGSDVDLQALARVQRGDPGLLTGDLQTLADFANQHPEVSTLPSAGARYAPPGLGKDLGQVNVINPRSWVQPILGTLARRTLTGSPGAAGAAARSAPVTGLGGEFEPLQSQPPQPPPGMSASTPTAPQPAAPGPPGQIPLADLLSHGVEQKSAPGLSSGPMGAAPPAGIPFTRNAAHEAGGLTLADLLSGPRTYGGNNADLAPVMSQGVPEDIMARTAQNPGLKMPVAHSPAFIANNASGESAASQEAINRGTAPLVEVDPDGNERPVLRDVTQADIEPTRGHLIVDKSTGQIVKSGGMAPALARGLLNRWKSTQQSLGGAF